MREKVPFPGVLGRVCFHPCEAVCRRGQLNEPIAIKALKRFASDSDNGYWKQHAKQCSSSGKKVAIVGSGPAGLTAAYYLAKAGHAVAVCESLSEAGGMLRVGIPKYRLPREVLRSEIEEIKKTGVEIKLNTRVTSIASLLTEGYDAVFVATGAHRSIRMGIPGENSPGVLEAIQFLRKANLGEHIELGNRVAVIGGGNGAIDAARTALRTGAEAMIIYRRTRVEMPASDEEIEAGIREGMKIEFLAAPARIARENGHLKVKCVTMKLGEPDASGRRRPEPMNGSEFTLEVDAVISAIGQEPDLPEEFGLSLSSSKTIHVDPESMATEIEGVFAGGDVVSGPASVIDAISDGRRAATAIDRYLGGSGEIEEKLTPEYGVDPWIGRDEGFAHWTRINSPFLLQEQYSNNFTEVECTVEETAARKEAKRCLNCDLRLQISPVILPPEKWLVLNGQNVAAVPEMEGVYQLLNTQKEITLIKGTANLRRALEEHLDSIGSPSSEIRYFVYEENPMYTARESELIQQFLQKYGKMPSGDDDLDDLF